MPKTPTASSSARPIPKTRSRPEPLPAPAAPRGAGLPFPATSATCVMAAHVVTPRQLIALSLIAGHIAGHGVAPTLRGLCDLMGTASTSNAHWYVTHLAEHGLIRFDLVGGDRMASRTIRITDAGQDLLNRLKGGSDEMER
jgi:LexA DNA binding domain